MKDNQLKHSKFPCSSCGACCRRIKTAVHNLGIGNVKRDDEYYFPYQWDESGRCEMLTEDNKCAVYDNRPIICNIDKFCEEAGMSKKNFYEGNIDFCNKMMDEDGVDQKFRIRIKESDL